MRTASELSFLDTISCALGGVIVLFFIFAALKDEGEREALSDPIEFPSTKRVISIKAGAERNLAPTHYEIAGLNKDCELITLDKNLVGKRQATWRLSVWEPEDTEMRIDCNSGSNADIDLKLYRKDENLSQLSCRPDTILKLRIDGQRANMACGGKQ